MERAHRAASDVADRRDEFGVEAPWASLTRLLHDYLGTWFALTMSEMERGFRDASVATHPSSVTTSRSTGWPITSRS